MLSPDIFLFGCLGAIAPEILRLYKLRQSRNIKFSLFYIFISLMFTGFGGIIALILEAPSYYNAFYCGLATPIIISSLAKTSLQIEESSPPNQETNWSEFGKQEKHSIDIENTRISFLDRIKHFLVGI